MRVCEFKNCGAKAAFVPLLGSIERQRGELYVLYYAKIKRECKKTRRAQHP